MLGSTGSNDLTHFTLDYAFDCKRDKVIIVRYWKPRGLHFFAVVHVWPEWHDLRGCPPLAHRHVVRMSRFLFLTETNRTCPLPFVLFLRHFLSLWPFQLYFIPYILPTTLRFPALLFQSYFCLIGPFNYISLYESLLQSWYNPLWLSGLKATTN